MEFRDCGSARLLFNTNEWVSRILYARQRRQIAQISHCSIQNELRDKIQWREIEQSKPLTQASREGVIWEVHGY